MLGEDAGWDKAGRPVTWCLTLAKLPLGSLEAGPTPKGMLVFEANLTLPEARAFSRVFSFFLNGSQIFPSLSIQFWFPHIAIQRGQLFTCSLHIPPPTHTHTCSSCVLSKVQHGAYLLCSLQLCPAATSAQDLSWTQKSLTKKPEVQGRTNDGHLYGLLISE